MSGGDYETRKAERDMSSEKQKPSALLIALILILPASGWAEIQTPSFCEGDQTKKRGFKSYDLCSKYKTAEALERIALALEARKDQVAK